MNPVWTSTARALWRAVLEAARADVGSLWHSHLVPRAHVGFNVAAALEFEALLFAARDER